MKLSILIVNWNTRDLLARCLESVTTAVEGRAAEVIVVDNGSTDGSAALVRERWPTMTLITNERNAGFAHGNNQAFAASHGDLILLLNTDAILSRAALTALLAPLETDPTLGGTTSVLINPDGSIQVGYHRGRVTGLRLLGTLLHNGKVLRNNRLAREFLLLDRRLDEDRVIEQPAATCWLLRRQAIESSNGLFDERLPIHFNDIELSERLRRHNWHTRLVAASRVIHDGGSTVERLDPYLLKELYLVSEVLYLRSSRPFWEYLLVKATLMTIAVVLYALTSLGFIHSYFNIPITDRGASLTAQGRIMHNLMADRLPPLP